MTIYKAPNFTPYNRPRIIGLSVFLCGSIEMGKAEHWQKKAGTVLSGAGYIVLDPRRDDWDSSWEQTIHNDQFFTQVRWELTGLEMTTTALVHFDPATKSPITLLELGMLSQMKPDRTFVSCPEDYWRRGNVEVLVDRYHIPFYESLDEAIGGVLVKLRMIEKEEKEE